MEQQQQQQIMNDQDQSGNSKSSGGGGGGGGFMCRQSSTRWTPTSDQIRILKELYYNNGVRSPSADQIQRISARLRQYGKIEGKNVFYWFQNHKARERQKKRFTTTNTTTVTTTDHHHHHHHHIPIYNNKYSHITTTTTPSAGVASPCSSSSPGMVAVGQMGNYAYGSVTMEKSFRDCSISAGGGGGGGSGTIGHNFGWVGVDSYTYPFFDKRKSSIDHYHHETLEDQEQEDKAQEIETLPLFPMHGSDERFAGFCNIKPESGGNYYTGWYRSDNGMVSSRTSLELTLNSYAGRSSGSN